MARVPGIRTPSIENPTCARCVIERERAEYVSKGHGTPAEIRAAIAALAAVPPLGATVKVKLEGGRGMVAICPRHGNLRHEGELKPVGEIARNRKARRRARVNL